MSASLGTILLLFGLPVGLTLVFVLGKSLPLKLSIWFATGYFISQWMHVMIFVFRDKISNHTSTTKLNILYFYHVKWFVVLMIGITLSIILCVILYYYYHKIDSINFKYIVVTILVATTLSQISGSSIPKLFGEFSFVTFYLLGIFAHKYFLTYASSNLSIPSYQIQSDALTSLGLLIAILSIWSPFVIAFAEFLFKKYFQNDALMIQFQLTRYSFYIFWNILAISILGWRCLELLIQARNDVL